MIEKWKILSAFFVCRRAPVTVRIRCLTVLAWACVVCRLVQLWKTYKAKDDAHLGDPALLACADASVVF
jgi:hypothetical protein